MQLTGGLFVLEREPAHTESLRTYQFHPFSITLEMKMDWLLCARAMKRIERNLLWKTCRPQLRRLYRRLGYPFGQNASAFKRWVLNASDKFFVEATEAHAL